MRVILASSNKGKIKEIKKLLESSEVIPYREILGDIEIAETGSTFKENALIKAREIYERVKNDPRFKEAVIISDDSGITVPALGNVPGIYSARFAKEGATDKENLNKLIKMLKSAGLKRSRAYYTAAVAIVGEFGEYTVHGWMWGDVIDEPRGERGFGYDPMFIPLGYSKTLGELDDSVKEKISHRSKAFKNAMRVLKTVGASFER